MEKSTFFSKIYIVSISTVKRGVEKMKAQASSREDSPMDFANTEIAFKHHSDQSLYKTYILFKTMSMNKLVSAGAKLLQLAFQARLPVLSLVRITLFRQFCGGETLGECQELTKSLESFGIGSILDYSAEAKSDEESFEATFAEILQTIEISAQGLKPAFAVFKMSGLGGVELLRKVQDKKALSGSEDREYTRIRQRVRKLCVHAERHQVRLMIDAEDYFFQAAVDDIALDMMKEFNKKSAVVYNTLQMYRHDRLAYLKVLHAEAEKSQFFLGFKIVRGAYLEKERSRAALESYPDPIYTTKEQTDRAFDDCLAFCVERIDRIWIMSGTHNEKSNLFLAKKLEQCGVARDDHRVVFSQLLGMSDNLSYNLAHHGYLVRKYVPFGPIKEVLPYLIRRAEENTAIQGQTTRELNFLLQEISRRKALKATTKFSQ
jgi:proline dehydrogenase